MGNEPNGTFITNGTGEEKEEEEGGEGGGAWWFMTLSYYKRPKNGLNRVLTLQRVHAFANPRGFF